MVQQVEGVAAYSWMKQKDLHRGLNKALHALTKVVGENMFAFKLFSIKMTELQAFEKQMGDKEFQLGVRSTNMVVSPVIDKVGKQHQMLVGYQEAHMNAADDGVGSSQE